MATTGRVTTALLLFIVPFTAQVWGLNDGISTQFPPPSFGGGWESSGSYYPGPAPYNGKSWKGSGGSSIFTGGGSSYYPGKSWDSSAYYPGGFGWGQGPITPVVLPSGGSSLGYKPEGLLGGLKGKIKSKFSKFSGLKGWMGGGLPHGFGDFGNSGFGNFGGNSGFGGSSKFGGKFSKSKFGKGGYSNGGISYPQIGGYPTGGFPSGGFITGGYPTGGYPTGGYPTGGYPIESITSSNSCYDSSQCGLRSCCIPTPYGTRCQPMTPFTVNSCLDPRPIPPPNIPPPAVLPPIPSSIIFPPSANGGKSWRPPPVFRPANFPPSRPIGKIHKSSTFKGGIKLNVVN